MNPVGIDVSKDLLEVATGEGRSRIARNKQNLDELMASLPADTVIAAEATGRYHRMVVQAAADAGREIRLVDPHGFSHYRKSVHPRAKNDRLDAKALRRYAEKESDRLRPAKPSEPQLQRLKDLLELRETQVKLRTAWRQSMSEFEKVPAATKRALESMNKSIADLDKRILEIGQRFELYERLKQMDGVGECLAPALVWLFTDKSFENDDQPVAFTGMDVAVRQSGKFEGKRKLTKRGPAFIRRLLYCASNSLRRNAEFADLFAKHHAKGLRTKGVNVAVGRKILRTAYHLASNPELRYNRAKFLGGVLT